MAKKTAPPIVESDEIPVIDSKDIPTPEPITSEPKTEEPSASIEDVLTLQRRLDSMKQSAINGLLKRIEEAKSQLRELGYTEDVPFAAASPTPTKRKYAARKAKAPSGTKFCKICNKDTNHDGRSPLHRAQKVKKPLTDAEIASIG